MAAKKKLGEILVEAGVIDKFQLQSALAEQRKWGGRLGNHLVQMGILTEEVLVKALATQLEIAALDLSAIDGVPKEVTDMVPRELAEKFHLMPVRVKTLNKQKTLIVAMSDPTNLDAIDEIRFRTGHRVKSAVAGDTAIEMAIRRYYYGETEDTRQPNDAIPLPGDDAAMMGRTPEVANASAGLEVSVLDPSQLGDPVGGPGMDTPGVEPWNQPTEPEALGREFAPPAAFEPQPSAPGLPSPPAGPMPPAQAKPTRYDPFAPPDDQSGSAPWDPTPLPGPLPPVAETKPLATGSPPPVRPAVDAPGAQAPPSSPEALVAESQPEPEPAPEASQAPEAPVDLGSKPVESVAPPKEEAPMQATEPAAATPPPSAEPPAVDPAYEAAMADPYGVPEIGAPEPASVEAAEPVEQVEESSPAEEPAVSASAPEESEPEVSEDAPTSDAPPKEPMAAATPEVTAAEDAPTAGVAPVAPNGGNGREDYFGEVWSYEGAAQGAPPEPAPDRAESTAEDLAAREVPDAPVPEAAAEGEPADAQAAGPESTVPGEPTEAAAEELDHAFQSQEVTQAPAELASDTPDLAADADTLWSDTATGPLANRAAEALLDMLPDSQEGRALKGLAHLLLEKGVISEDELRRFLEGAS